MKNNKYIFIALAITLIVIGGVSIVKASPHACYTSSCQPLNCAAGKFDCSYACPAPSRCSISTNCGSFSGCNQNCCNLPPESNCTYISSVTSWSACVDGLRYAVTTTNAKGSSANDPICVDVPLEESCTMATCYDPAVVNTTPLGSLPSASDLIAYWRFDNNFNEEINNFDAWPAEGVTFSTSGKFPKSLNPNGTAFAKVGDTSNFGSRLNLGTASAYTVSTWVNLNNLTTSAVVDFDEAESNSFSLRFDNGKGWTVYDQDNVILGQSTPTVGFGNWVHVAIVKNGSTWKLYQNGVKILENATYGNLVHEPSKINFGYSKHFDIYLNGKLDDFGIFNRALTDCEIKQIALGPNACLAACSSLSATCFVSPTNAAIGAPVTWSVNSANGTTPYFFSWKFTDFADIVSSSTATAVSKTYQTIGRKYATTTVTDSAEPANSITIPCPGSVSADGGSGGGTGSGGSGVNITAAPTCDDGISNGLEDGQDCGGPDCEACAIVANPIRDPALNCTSISTSLPSPVNVNNQITFTASPADQCPSCVKSWGFVDGNNIPTNFSNTGSDSWNKIFTTTGLKTVAYRLSTTTTASLDGIYGICSTTTNIVLTGGSNREI